MEKKAANRGKRESLPDLELTATLEGLEETLRVVEKKGFEEERALTKGYIVVWIETDCFGNLGRIGNKVKRGGELLKWMADLMLKALRLRVVFVISHVKGVLNYWPDALSRKDTFARVLQDLIHRGFCQITPQGAAKQWRD